MNWEAIGAIGEIVGALAVVISLVYLALQIRTQNREAKLSSIHEITTAHRDVLSQLQNPNISDIWVEATTDFENLEPSKQVRFVSVAVNIYKVSEEAYYQAQSGRLESHIWQGMVAQLSEFHSWPGAQQVWRFRQSNFSQPFIDFVDSIAPPTLKDN
ncbi:MAG: hypothetical protein GKR90_17795 [Pseudomonadales bacterium]|nr:hypothetical protein [Pseudomonadales bacterium]